MVEASLIMTVSKIGMTLRLSIHIIYFNFSFADITLGNNGLDFVEVHCDGEGINVLNEDDYRILKLPLNLNAQGTV